MPWLLGVATLTASNHRRSAQRHARAFQRLAGRREESSDGADDVLARLSAEQAMADVLAAVDRLPSQEREVLALCVWDGLDYEAASVALGVPIGTVRSRLSRARSRLREVRDASDGGRGPTVPTPDPCAAPRLARPTTSAPHHSTRIAQSGAQA